MKPETIRKTCSILIPLVVVGVIGAALVALAAGPINGIITAIDAKTAVVTAKETATGRSFQFRVKDAALRKSLKVGQKISADLKAMRVTLPAARPGAKAVRLRIMKAEPVGTPASPPAGATASPQRTERPVPSTPNPQQAAGAATTTANTALLPPDPAPKSCNRNHPGRTDRVLYAAQHGDAKTAKRVATHVTKYSLRRYDMADLFTDAQVDVAANKVYEFLKWKLGGPTPVATTWVAHGFGHFDRAYVDEAAAALLGFKIPKPGHNGVALSPQVLDLIYGATVYSIYTTGTGNPWGPGFLLAWMQVATIELGLSNSYWFSDFAFELAATTTNAAAQIEFNWPQGFDFPNSLIYWDLRARRYQVNAKRKLAQEVDSALAQRQARSRQK